MPRQLQFDQDKALNRATLLFWKKGYRNTSLKDLLKVTQLGEGSFYNTLKSKKALYRACMDHYNQTITKTRLDLFLSEKSVKIGVKKYFEAVLQGFMDRKLPNGCLMSNSLSADVIAEKDFKNYLTDGFEFFEKIFADQFDKAKSNGELPNQFNSRLTAEIFVTFLQGLFRVSLINKNPSQCRRQVVLFLQVTGLS